MSFNRIFHNLSSSLNAKVKPECIRRCSNSLLFLRGCHNNTNTCLLSNPPYPIPKNREAQQRPEELHKSNQYYGESYLHSTVRFLIHNLSDLDTAMEYSRLTAFTETRGPTTTATCDLMISALCEAKRYRDSYDLFHYFFNESKIKLSVSCCNHIVKALCEDGFVEEALQLHHHIRSCCSSSDNNNVPSCLDYLTYRILTKGLCYAGKIDEALDLVKDIFSLSDLSPPPKKDYENLVSLFSDHDELDFNKIWALCCSVSLKIINTSYPTVTETAKTVTLIEYCFSQCQWKKGMELYTCLTKNKAIIEDTASQKPLFEVLFKYGKRIEACSLFKKMVSDPDFFDEHSDRSESINAIINELFKVGKSKDAVDTFFHLWFRSWYSKNRFNMQGPCYNFITRCCEEEEENLLSPASKIFGSLTLMSSDTSTCKISTYEEMIFAFLKAGRLDDALDTANKMVEATVKQLSSLMKT